MKFPALLVAVPVILAALGGTYALSHSDKTPEAAPAAAPAPTVTVAAVTQTTLSDVETFTGRLEASRWTEIRPRVAGHIDSVPFQAGQLVQKGDILFQIDPRWHRAALDSAEAEVSRTEAALRLAERDAARAGELTKSNAISKEEADGRSSRVEMAVSAHHAAIAARDTARLDLEQTTVRAPIAGRVSRALVTEGNYVAGPSVLLTTIATVSEMHVYADLDEASYLRLQQHLSTLSKPEKLRVRLGEDNDAAPLAATLESIDNRLNPTSGSILLRATVPNPDGKLTPGLFVRVEVPLSSDKPTLLVDESAIGTDQSQKYVMVVDSGNKVAYRSVKLGRSVSGKRIVSTGLTGGETIVVNGLQRVRSGVTVRPEIAGAPSHGTNSVAQR